MKKPRALDLFCKAGGATKGLQRAGFHVTGVDIEPQPRYCGDAFIQADARTVDLSGYDLIWASPPCQFGSELTPAAHRGKHPNLIPEIRRRLCAANVPYIIENVENVRRHLINPVKLCGSMFGLSVWRHRYFEAPLLPLTLLPPCNHSKRPVVVSGRVRDGKEPNAAQRRVAMGIGWMTIAEMDEAIPPAYSEYLGRQVMSYLTRADERVA
jgi:DNA (cytosine-5)-methyltransferase 1